LFTATVKTGAESYDFTLAVTDAGEKLSMFFLDAGTGTSPSGSCNSVLPCASTTGTYTSTGGGTNAVAHLSVPANSIHYYWVIVDGFTASDSSAFTLQITNAAAACP